MSKAIKKSKNKSPLRAPKQDVEWTPFCHADNIWSSGELPERFRTEQVVVLNSRYTVIISKEKSGFGDLIHLSIRHNDRRAIHDWRDMQRIKNELCGAEAEGIELYPAESRLVDTANSYHIYVLADDRKFPFGFNGRLISDGDNVNRPGEPCQRPFDPDNKPTDTKTKDEILKSIGSSK